VQKAVLVETHSSQQQQQQQQRQPVKIPHQKASRPPSGNLLYPVVNKEVEQQFSGRGDIVTRETCDPTSLKVNNLGKAAVLHFASHSLLLLGLGQT
jgi:hypothetical protein